MDLEGWLSPIARRRTVSSRLSKVAGGIARAWTIAIAFGLGVAHAQTPAAAAPRQLTMDDALAMAKRANKNLVVERARLAQAHTNIEQAWSALFPVVTAQGKYTRNYKNATLNFGALLMGLGFQPTMPASGGYDITILKQDQFDANVSAIMPLIAPAAYPALDAVKKGYGSSEANYEASEDTVLYSVAQAFYTAAVSDEVLVVRDSAINVAQATLDNSQTRFAAGTVTKVDVDRAELALVRAKQSELDARYGREQSYRALSTLIQADGPLKAVPPETLPPPGETTLTWRCTCAPSSAASSSPKDLPTPRAAPTPGSGRPRCRRSARRTSVTTSASPATTTPGPSGPSSTGRCSTAAPGTRSATWRPRRRRRRRRRRPCSPTPSATTWPTTAACSTPGGRG